MSEPNYHAAKCFSENLIAIEMKKTEVKMKKPIYLGFSILSLSKFVMYEFWHDKIKPNYGKKQNYVIWTQIALLFILKLKFL